MRGYFSTKDKAAYCVIRNFSYRDATELGVFLEPWEDEVGFGVSASVIKEYMHRVNRHLDWQEYRNQLYSWHPLKPGTGPAALVKVALNDLRALKRALKKA